METRNSRVLYHKSPKAEVDRPLSTRNPRGGLRKTSTDPNFLRRVYPERSTSPLSKILLSSFVHVVSQKHCRPREVLVCATRHGTHEECLRVQPHRPPRSGAGVQVEKPDRSGPSRVVGLRVPETQTPRLGLFKFVRGCDRPPSTSTYRPSEPYSNTRGTLSVLTSDVSRHTFTRLHRDHRYTYCTWNIKIVSIENLWVKVLGVLSVTVRGTLSRLDWSREGSPTDVSCGTDQRFPRTINRKR